jgi:hypothetical protein
MSAIVFVSLVDREWLPRRRKRNPVRPSEIRLVIVNAGRTQFVGGGKLWRRKPLV